MLRSSLLALGVCTALAGSAAAAPPSNGYIGAFGDVAGTVCCISTNASGNGHVYVFAVTGGASAAGITGAEFKVSVEPAAPGATFSWNPASGTTSNGAPMDNGSGGGITVSFGNCQTQTGLAGDKVLLGTVHVFGMTTEHQLVVRRTDTPVNPSFMCPSVQLCDSPAFTQVCLTYQQGDPALGGEEPAAFTTVVNSATCAGTSCGFVAVNESTWSQVKHLYQ